MNQNFSKTALAMVFATVILAGACKKSSNPSEHDNFVGKWKLHQVVTDENKNGIIDAADSTYIEDTLNIVLTLNGNGTATSTSIFGTSSPFTWALSSGNTYLLITDSGSVAAIGNMIVTAPGSTFVIKDTTGGNTNWETLVKQ